MDNAMNRLRSRLRLAASSGALILALTMAVRPAQAQSFNATATPGLGAPSISTGAGTTTITIDGAPQPGALDYRFPNAMQLTVPAGKRVFSLMNVCLPVDERTTSMVFVTVRDFLRPRLFDRLFHFSNRRVANEDRAVLERAVDLVGALFALLDLLQVRLVLFIIDGPHQLLQQVLQRGHAHEVGVLIQHEGDVGALALHQAPHPVHAGRLRDQDGLAHQLPQRLHCAHPRHVRVQILAVHEADQRDHFEIAMAGGGQGGGRHGKKPSKTIRYVV